MCQIVIYRLNNVESALEFSVIPQSKLLRLHLEVSVRSRSLHAVDGHIVWIVNARPNQSMTVVTKHKNNNKRNVKCEIRKQQESIK